MNKILVLKNDRVGDLFNSLDGINAILKDNQTANIEIVLSQISRKLSFLFNINNLTVSYLPYHLNFTDKFRLFIKILNNDELRQKIAKTGRNKYFKFFNSTVIADFIITKTFNIKKKYFWENKN